MSARARDRRPHGHVQASSRPVPQAASPSALEELHDRLGGAGAAAWLSGAPLAAGEHVVQAKLTVGSASDPAEHEADRAADAILAGRAARVTGDSTVRRSAEGPGHALDADASLTTALDRAHGGGAPLPAAFQQRAESSLGADLSGVRVHDGARAHGLAGSLSALALTHGQDVFLGERAPVPGTAAGDRLLAHEVAHVAQQQGETVRRQLDPAALDISRITTARYLNAGMKNLGIFFLSDGTGKEIVAKFNKSVEDVGRQRVADEILKAAGLTSTTGGGWTQDMDFGQALLSKVGQLAQAAASAARTKEQAQAAAELTAGTQRAAGGVQVLLMRSVKGVDMNSFGAGDDAHRDDYSPVQKLQRASALEALGRSAVADAFMGNGDRFGFQGHDSKKLKTINAGNMLLTRKGVVGFVDSETNLFSRRVLAKESKKRAASGVRGWVDELVGGGHGFIDGASSMPAGVTWLLSDEHLRVLYDDYLETLAWLDARAPRTLTYRDFQTHVGKGMRDGYQGLLSEVRRIKALLSQDDTEMEGLADRNAFAVKVAYMKQRSRGADHDAATEYVVNKAKVLELLDDIEQPDKVLPAPGRSGGLRKAVALVSKGQAKKVAAKDAQRAQYADKLVEVSDLVGWRADRVGAATASLRVALKGLGSRSAAAQKAADDLVAVLDVKAQRVEAKTKVVLSHVKAWQGAVGKRSSDSGYDAAAALLAQTAHTLDQRTQEFLAAAAQGKARSGSARQGGG